MNWKWIPIAFLLLSEWHSVDDHELIASSLGSLINGREALDSTSSSLLHQRYQICSLPVHVESVSQLLSQMQSLLIQAGFNLKEVNEQCGFISAIAQKNEDQWIQISSYISDQGIHVQSLISPQALGQEEGAKDSLGWFDAQSFLDYLSLQLSHKPSESY